MKNSKWFFKNKQDSKPTRIKSRKFSKTKRAELLNDAIKKQQESKQETKPEYNPQNNDSIKNYLKRFESKKFSREIIQHKLQSKNITQPTQSNSVNHKPIESMSTIELFERQLKLNNKEITPESLNRMRNLQNKYKTNKYISNTLEFYNKKDKLNTENTPSVTEIINTPIQSDSSIRLIQNGKETKKQLYYSSNTITFGIQDCTYQAIARLLLWYRNSELNNFQIPLTHNQMISKKIAWKDWIQIQLNLQKETQTKHDDFVFTRSSFPSWKTWEKSITDSSGNRTPNIQTMANWLLNQFNMGILVIPQEYVQMILSMDELLFVEWPFLFGIKDRHIYPIINKRNSLDWHTKESKLVAQYKPNRRRNQNIIENLEGAYSRVLTCTKNPNYISIRDKKHIVKENIHCFKEQLESLEFVVLPYWSKKAIDIIRRAIFRLLRHPLGQEHPEFWKEFTSYSDTLLSFYEQHLE
jgi:hypothetical protein